MISLKTERGRLWWTMFALAVASWGFLGWEVAHQAVKMNEQARMEARI